MLFRLLSKKYVKDIILLLDARGEMGFSELRDTFNIDKSYLSRLLCELEDNGIISRREVVIDRRMPRSYFKLTPFGKKVIQLYELEDKLRSETSSITINGNITGNNNIIIGGSSHNVHIKK